MCDHTHPEPALLLVRDRVDLAVAAARAHRDGGPGHPTPRTDVDAMADAVLDIPHLLELLDNALRFAEAIRVELHHANGNTETAEVT